jgi:hypothetical protein
MEKGLIGLRGHPPSMLSEMLKMLKRTSTFHALRAVANVSILSK